MNFFQYLFCNQYAEIKGRGGDASKAQLNTILLSTVLITLYIILIFVLYGQLNPGFLEKYFTMGNISGRSVGRFFSFFIGLLVFLLLRKAIGSRTWYDRTVNEFEKLPDGEQKKAAKKGIQLFLLAALPVIAFIFWALISVFS